MSHSDVLVNIRRAFVPLAAIRALEPRGLTTLVAQVSPEALDHSVTVIALRANVITTTTSSSSNRPPNARTRVGFR